MATSCSACGKQFGSESGFNLHRVGRHTNEHPHYGRRCLSDEELTAKGWTSKDGAWREGIDERFAAVLAARRAQEAQK